MKSRVIANKEYDSGVSQPRTQVLNLRSYLAWIETLVSAGNVTRHILADLLNCF
jgi:hypothetical protein